MLFSDIQVRTSYTDTPVDSSALQKFLKSRFNTLLFQYSSPSDNNGYLYYIATKQRTHSYDNPHNNKFVCLTASTYHPASSYGDISLILNEKQETFYTDNDYIAEQWIKLDLMNNRPIIPNYYRLNGASFGGSYALRNWEFQGSQNGLIWTALTKHEDDQQIENGRDNPIAWKIKDYGVAYRYFRIYSTTTQERGTYFMSLGAIEIYGRVHL
jgi:hypothetical protein